MMKMLEYDSGITRFVLLLIDLTKLNLLWLITSLPLITMGAATAAMYSAASKLKEGDKAILRNYRSGFRQHWKQATIVWVIFLALTAAFYMDYHLLTTAVVPGQKILAVISILAFLTLVFVMLWIYAVMANYKGSVWELVFNAFIFSFLYAPVTLITAGAYALAAYLFLSFMPARVLCLVFGHALVVYCNLSLYSVAFKKR